MRLPIEFWHTDATGAIGSIWRHDLEEEEDWRHFHLWPCFEREDRDDSSLSGWKAWLFSFGPSVGNVQLITM